MGAEPSMFAISRGLQAPWSVTDVQFEAELKEIHFYVRFKAGSRFAFPSCGAADLPTQDMRSRTWGNPSFIEHKAFMHAAVPRVACGQCGQTGQLPVSCEGSAIGFSKRVDVLSFALAREVPVTATSDLRDIGDGWIWLVVEHHVPVARAEEGFFDVTAAGIDETALRQGHNSITLFHDLNAGRLLFACEGRNADMFQALTKNLRAHGGGRVLVTVAGIDVSEAYSTGVAWHLTEAGITLDCVHVIEPGNAALEEVRRAEVHGRIALKNSRWMWPKGKHSSIKRQFHQQRDLPRKHLKISCALRLKATVQDIFMTATTREESDVQLSAWFRCARHGKLAPFKKLAMTLKTHWDGILYGFDSSLSNGSVGAVNGLIWAAMTRSRGYCKARSLTLIAYLGANSISDLPASLYVITADGHPA